MGFKINDRVIIKGDCYLALNEQPGTVIATSPKLKLQLDNGIKCWPKPECVFKITILTLNNNQLNKTKSNDKSRRPNTTGYRFKNW